MERSTSGQNPEVLLDPTDNCLIIFPLKDDDSSFWTVEEIDISCDAYDWDNKLSDSERTLFSMILVFFTSADSIVTENILQCFSSEVQLPEAQFFYSFQAAMENIHLEVYSSLIQELIHDTWMQSSALFPQHLVAFAAVEGIICCDEGIHTNFTCLLYSKLKNQLPIPVLTAILTEACAIEKHIESMNKYIEYVTDRLLQCLGAPKAYNVTNLFPFMEMISLQSKTNFFEHHNTEYSLPNFSERGAHHHKL
ncbi:ribonucleotide reductase-related protein [Armillaria luteobubalina]|uniref:Ribonucleotide reductase-related protein n=1 Tax=Armillaria luteobubalina TaxID=153913 RepID=A0AA39QNH7_9AGAR|nr:ribonucleotide reductase-related protein [Armillaria luteobubalina]